MSDFYENGELPCPACKHRPTRYRECDVLNCEDGLINLYDEDPCYYDENDVEICEKCWGTGYQRWCPTCGADINYLREIKERYDEAQ